MLNFSQLSLRSEIWERQVCQKGCEYVLFIFSIYKKDKSLYPCSLEKSTNVRLGSCWCEFIKISNYRELSIFVIKVRSRNPLRKNTHEVQLLCSFPSGLSYLLNCYNLSKPTFQNKCFKFVENICLSTHCSFQIVSF